MIWVFRNLHVSSEHIDSQYFKTKNIFVQDVFSLIVLVNSTLNILSQGTWNEDTE